MVGNSVCSDVLPVIAVGGRAVHMVYEITWEHDHITRNLPAGAVPVAKLLDRLDTETVNDGEH
jgi:putative hydrolase of the HAD superfamily